MKTLSRQRCLVHIEREAVARCFECLHFFCRECILEHESKMICSGCLRKLIDRNKPAAKGRGLLGSSVLLTGSMLFLWLLFYLMGSIVLKIPHSFHDGSVWKQEWLDDGWEGEERE